LQRLAVAAVHDQGVEHRVARLQAQACRELGARRLGLCQVHAGVVGMTAFLDLGVQVADLQLGRDALARRGEAAQALPALDQAFGLQFLQRAAGRHPADAEALDELGLRGHARTGRPAPA
jgi:hypothetical protein